MSEKKIAILDLSHIIHKTWHACKDDRSRVVWEAMDRVQQLANNPIWEAMEIALDAPPYKRTEIYPEYKGNRPKAEPEFKEYATKVIAQVSKKWVTWESKGHEADDVIAAWCRLNKSMKCVVISSDKDLMQLIDKNTLFYDIRLGELCGEGKVKERFGVHPMYLRDYLALVGDAADNIKGCPGIGAVAAKKLITQHGTVERMLKSHTGYDKKLEEGREELFLSLQLVTLDAGIPLHRVKKEDNSMTEEEKHTSFSTMLDAAEARHNESARRAEPVAEAEAPTERPQNLGHTKSHILSAADIEGIRAAVKLVCKAPMYAKKADPLTLLSIAIQGAEMGFSPITFLQRSHVMHGSLCMSAHDIIGLAKAHPNTEYLECSEANDSSCTYVYKAKGGKERSFSYDLETARKDGLQWAGRSKNQKAMIRKTAGCQAARLFCPESLHGLYGVEEMDS